MAPVTRRRNPSKPTAGQLVRKRHVKVELNSKHNKACMLCGRKEISEKLYGLLYQLDDVVIHHFCLLLSSRSVQNGADNQGIWGFLLKDIRAELARASKKTCFYCEKKGASISCCGAKCPRVFHLPCGLKNGSMHQYFNTFKSFCEKHLITQTIELSELRKSTSTTCVICTDDVIRSPLPSSIWAPCCKRDGWFHRECIQDWALNAGYYFKCPLCNNVHKFKCTMLNLGIYIPSRDKNRMFIIELERRIIRGEHDTSMVGRNQIPKCLVEHIERANSMLDGIFSEEELEIIIQNVTTFLYDMTRNHGHIHILYRCWDLINYIDNNPQ